MNSEHLTPTLSASQVGERWGEGEIFVFFALSAVK